MLDALKNWAKGVVYGEVVHDFGAVADVRSFAGSAPASLLIGRKSGASRLWLNVPKHAMPLSANSARQLASTLRRAGDPELPLEAPPRQQGLFAEIGRLVEVLHGTRIHDFGDVATVQFPLGRVTYRVFLTKLEPAPYMRNPNLEVMVWLTATPSSGTESGLCRLDRQNASQLATALDDAVAHAETVGISLQ